MARYASLLIAVAATLAVAAASASAYARAADAEEELLMAAITVGDDGGDEFGLGGGGAIGRRRLDDLNGTSADAANATTADSNATSTGAGGFTGFISYLALSRDRVPCDQRGASYYSNCQPGAEANPYARGCSAITQCRG
ncbi:hypothetical protein ACP4OV_007152 [Aristida adscensionis]